MTSQKDITSQDKIARNQSERDEARQDLHEILTAVSAKLERAESDLRPDHLIESHPVYASLMAGALGFLFGSSLKSRVTGPVMIAALLGFAVVRRSSPEGKARDDRETSAD